MKAFDLRRQTSLLFLILSMGLLLFSSCRKYPDGPTLSLRSRVERVSNVWTASVISRNTINETNKYLIYTMDFSKNGRLTWTTQIAGETQDIIMADWQLFREDQQIKITLDEPDPNSGERLSFSFDIRRLEENEMWLQFIRFGDEWDIQLVD